MKGQCVEQLNDLATFIFKGENPIVGKWYTLEDATSHTDAQRKAVHALIQEWFKSGLWSYDTLDFAEFRNYVKRDYGVGFIKVSRKSLGIKNSHLYLPDEIEVLKSFSLYTKKEVQSFCDNIINAMIHAGVDTKKFHQIIDGMSSEKGADINS